jgi:8-oxo-dGTP pyrophosphatase MutT (NUDIX family)
VVLIHKNHGPKCVVGRWNGVGGHIEPGEEPIKAMVREFYEEAGVKTREHDWKPVAEINSGVAQVYFYTCEDEGYFMDAHTCTDEEIAVFAVRCLPPVVTNLTWMIPWLADPHIIRQYMEIALKKDQEI